MEIFLSLLPLLILLSVWALLLKRFKKTNAEQPAGPPDVKLYGVHGWLAFFIFISYYVAPLYSLGSLMSTFSEVARENPRFYELPEFQTYKFWSYVVAAVGIGWQIKIAYDLRWKRVRSSLIHARYFLFIAPIAFFSLDIIMAHNLFGTVDGQATFKSLLTAVAASLFWGLYFTLSRRCRNTYLLHPLGDASTTLKAEAAA